MDYSRITDDLFIGTTPNRKDYDHLRDLGVQLVINMRVEQRPFPDLHHIPLSFLWFPTFDSPFVPIPVRFLHRGAAAALETIKKGGKVYVHCAGGRHRGVAMGSAILIAQGMDPESAMDLIRERRSFADPHAFYIRSRILRFAREWNGYLKS
jgi:protein-tyrosine phosphatase